MCSLRRAITADMSTSLNVVSSAAVCWASTSRWAMRRRIGLIGTTSSSRALRALLASGSEMVSGPVLTCVEGAVDSLSRGVSELTTSDFSLTLAGRSFAPARFARRGLCGSVATRVGLGRSTRLG